MLKKKFLLELLLVFIITIPAFYSLLNNQYFPMHDDQHIARLFLLDQGIRQGSLFPRWVDGLGFGFGYPLFNFYPPLIYYVAGVFRLLGFSLILSIKAMIITGFITGAFGMYLLAKRFMGKAAAMLSTTLYTFFTYHAVLVYVRGALAEFFALSILPFVFLTLHDLYKKPSTKSAIFFGISFALLILAHPLIAFPTTIYIGLFVVFCLLFCHPEPFGSPQDKLREGYPMRFSAPLRMTFLGSFLALGLSAFFWLPSMLERKFTLVDKILLTELASYKIHFVYPFQFWYSQWGYGGSVAGPIDGLSFQLGKIHIFILVTSVLFSFIYIYYLRRINRQKNDTERLSLFYFLLFFLVLSLFMTTGYSAFIWDKVHFLWYLQFPWRFLTFATIFISLCGGFIIYFVSHLFKRLNTQTILALMVIGASTVVIIQYQKYFRPQRLITTTDQERTTSEEISWRISRTSFEFVPKGVATKKSEFGTTILDIDKKDLPKKPYEIVKGNAAVSVKKNNFSEKVFVVNAKTPVLFRLNTYNFPGWHAFSTPIAGLPRGGQMDSSGVAEQLVINDNNSHKLITINLPSGNHKLVFKFEDTPARKIGNFLSISSIILVLWLLSKSKLSLK